MTFLRRYNGSADRYNESIDLCITQLAQNI
jgi:hypothetical protein